MIIYLVTSIIFCILATMQVGFYLTIKKKKRLLITVLMEIIIMWQYLYTEDMMKRMLMACLSIIIIVPLLYTCYDGKRYNKIYNIMIEAFASSLFIFIASQMSSSFVEWKSVCIACFTIFFQMAWCHFMYFMRINFFTTIPYSEETYKKNNYIILSGYVPLVITLSGALNPYIQDGYTWGIIGTTFVLFLILAIQSLTATKKELITSNKLESFVLQQGVVRKYVDSIQAMQQQIRIMNHDQKHYLATMETLLENEDYDRAKEYVKSQKENNIINKSQFVFCEDNLINAILTDTNIKALEKGVKFETEIRLGEKILIDDVALSVILLNSLSNAIESFQEFYSSKEKWVFMKLYTAKGYMVLNIKNSIDREIYIVNNKVASTKADDGMEHGIGLESIQSVVDSYEGRLKIAAENKVFELQAILKNKL